MYTWGVATRSATWKGRFPPSAGAARRRAASSSHSPSWLRLAQRASLSKTTPTTDRSTRDRLHARPGQSAAAPTARHRWTEPAGRSPETAGARRARAPEASRAAVPTTQVAVQETAERRAAAGSPPREERRAGPRTKAGAPMVGAPTVGALREAAVTAEAPREAAATAEVRRGARRPVALRPRGAP